MTKDRIVQYLKKNIMPIIVGSLLTAIGMVWLNCYSNSMGGWKGKDLEKLGQFGDSFGVATSIFTGITCIGLVITITFQMIEKKERDTDRHQDRFEDHFYKQIDFLNEYRNIEAIHHHAREMDICLQRLEGRIKNSEPELHQELKKKMGNKGLDNRVITYLDLFAHTLFYLDAAKIRNKDLYRIILRSQIVDSQMKILLCFSLTHRIDIFYQIAKKNKIFSMAYSSSPWWEELIYLVKHTDHEISY